MPPSQAPATLEMRTRLHSIWLPLSLLALGLVARLAWAYSVFLNPDEALHYLLSVQSSLALTYQATLLTAHPPLLIVLLHYWSLLGTSEFVLRLPSVIAGTAFCWIMFLWLERVTDHATALIGLSLLLFSPALMYLSAEIRQYSLLLFFMACSLFFLDRAIGESSSLMVLLSALALYLALLTHYSALIFALTLGIYALVRFRSSRTQALLIGVWGVTQLGGLGLVGFLLKSHVLKMRARGMSQALADTYLRGAVFHAGQERVLPFILKANIRLFHYMFSQGAVGVLGLLLYFVGIGLLLADKGPAQDSSRPSSRQLALLLVLPLAINCGLALAGLYPLGGTRHNSFLAGFAMSGVAVALSRWRTPRKWQKAVAIAIMLAICNFSVTPAGAYMRPQNQRRALMQQATEYLSRSIPKNSTILTDGEGSLLLSYYFCHRLISSEESHSNDKRIIVFDPRQWLLRTETFPSQIRNIQQRYELRAGTKAWLFQAGFLVDREPELRAEVVQYGCTRPQSFGQNIFLCELTLSAINHPTRATSTHVK
jgi:Dolichyl-phosphate-mannose-protein mannosyltransferase